MNVALNTRKERFPLEWLAALAGGRWLLPLVFVASLLLSAIALFFDPVIARDASLYIDIAHIANQSGVAVARSQFDWPWFPILLGLLQRFSGVEAETLAHLLCESFTALSCVLVVDMFRRVSPQQAGWAALVVLCLPAFNDYRADILRENGFWCFSLLSVWALLRWDESQQLRMLALSVAATALACFFRLEAVFLFGVLVLFAALRTQRTCAGRGAVLLGVALLFASLGVALVMALHAGLLPGDRVAYYVSRLDLGNLTGGFGVFALQVAEAMPFKYARDDVGLILGLGIGGYFLVRVLGCLGMLAVPFCFGARSLAGERSRPWLAMDLAALLYALVLLLFLYSNLFLSQRYIALLTLLLLPRIVQGVTLISGRWPRLSGVIVAFLVLQALANVVSTSAPKTQLRDAGHWMAENLQASDKIYAEDKRVRFYAGWSVGLEQPTREEALARHGEGAFSYFVLDLKRHPEAQIAALAEQGLTLVASFQNVAGDACGVFRRALP